MKRGETKIACVPPNGQLLVRDLTENIEPDYSGFVAMGKRAAQDRVDKVLEVVLQEPKPKRYVPPEHSECAAHRPPNRCYTVVVNTTRICTNKETIITRYCSCGWCRPANPGESRRSITHKDVEIIPHK